MQLVKMGVHMNRRPRFIRAFFIAFSCSALAMGVGVIAAFVLLPASASVGLTEVFDDAAAEYFGGISAVWGVIAVGAALVAAVAWVRVRARGGSLAQQRSTLVLLSAGPVLTFLALPWTSVGGDIYRLDPTFSLDGPISFIPSLYVIGAVATVVGLVVALGGERTPR